jgi:hypothetical protein
MTAKKAIIGALTLYLDFINLFIMLLQLTVRCAIHLDRFATATDVGLAPKIPELAADPDSEPTLRSNR